MTVERSRVAKTKEANLQKVKIQTKALEANKLTMLKEAS